MNEIEYCLKEKQLITLYIFTLFIFGMLSTSCNKQDISVKDNKILQSNDSLVMDSIEDMSKFMQCLEYSLGIDTNRVYILPTKQ